MKKVIVLSLLIMVICSFVACNTTENSSIYESLLTETMGLTDEQDSAIVELFTACGIGEIIEIDITRTVELEGETIYFCKDKGTSYYSQPIYVSLFNDTKQVKGIGYNGHDIYTAGGAIDNIQNYYANEEKRAAYRTASEALVKQYLARPSSAKFEKDWTYSNMSNGQITVKSVVRYKLDIGTSVDVMNNSNFQIIFNGDTPISLIIGETEYLK